MLDFLTTCEAAARAGGRVLLDWQGRITAREKGPKDLVTEADLASQRAIEQIVLGAFPDHAFVGEEDTGVTHNDTAEYRWIVDPLDGTTNYVHRLQTFCVSVALEHQGEVIAGCVYDPMSDECYRASVGDGAFLNGEPIRVSRCAELPEALIAASFSADVPRDSEEVGRFMEILFTAQATRRLGSAALNLSYLAAGRLDGYFATSVSPWDVAAGVLIVREAGGVVSHVDGSAFDLANPRFAASSTPELHKRFIAALSKATA